MAKIKVLSKCEIYDGMSITFKAPCDCTAVDGLNVYYNEYSQPFSFRDANRNDLGSLARLFSEGAYIKAILDTRNGYAYLQNADTNAFIENNLYTKEDLLTEATKSMYGLGADATPNTVFQKLAMPYGYYGFDITTVFSDGSPAPHIVLEGLEDFSGNTVMTDENGRCPIAVSKSQTPTVSIAGYLDVVDTTATISADDSAVFTPVTITVEKKTVTHELKNSLTARTTGASSYDITVVGGGGGGTTGSNGGGGGGGGYISTELNVPITTTTLSVVVGAGGGRATDVYNTVYAGSGGQSYVTDGNGETLVSANGGSGAYGTSGGAGNGNGGNSGQKGNNATGYLFNDESLGVPGGGGGAGTYRGGAEAGVWNQLPGGSPYGGGGGHNYKDIGWEIHYYGGEDGKGPGGGGGAGYGSHYGGNGAAGAVFMRARFA